MTTAIATPVGRAFCKARQGMQGDAKRRLDDALAEISPLRKRLAEIEAEQSHHVRRFARYVAECREKFERTKTFEDELALLQAEIAKDWHERHAADPATRAKLLYGIQALPTAESEAFETFAKEHPNWREPCETAIASWVEIARRTEAEVVTVVSRQLADFDSEEIERDPRLKAARRELGRWKEVEDRFADTEGLQAWQIAIRALFSE